MAIGNFGSCKSISHETAYGVAGFSVGPGCDVSSALEVQNFFSLLLAMVARQRMIKFFGLLNIVGKRIAYWMVEVDFGSCRTLPAFSAVGNNVQKSGCFLSQHFSQDGYPLHLHNGWRLWNLADITVGMIFRLKVSVAAQGPEVRDRICHVCLRLSLILHTATICSIRLGRLKDHSLLCR